MALVFGDRARHTLLNAVGINFNVPPADARATASLLAHSGFTRARIEVGWGSLDFDHPGRFSEADRESFVAKLIALRENGIRPLILLNANHGEPCPVRRDSIRLTAPAAAGSRLIRVDPLQRALMLPAARDPQRGGRGEDPDHIGLSTGHREAVEPAPGEPARRRRRCGHPPI